MEIVPPRGRGEVGGEDARGRTGTRQRQEVVETIKTRRELMNAVRNILRTFRAKRRAN